VSSRNIAIHGTVELEMNTASKLFNFAMAIFTVGTFYVGYTAVFNPPEHPLVKQKKLQQSSGIEDEKD